MQSHPIKKSIFQHTKISISHRTKANEQSQILSAKTYCELAVHLLFFEKYQSCVSCTATLSHRFKAFTPAFCGQNRFRYVPRKFLQNHFRQSFESSPESRGSQTSGVLLVLFVHAKRINPFPFREVPRFRKPQISTPQPQLRTATIKTFLRKASRFCKPRISTLAKTVKQNYKIDVFQYFNKTFLYRRKIPDIFPKTAKKRKFSQKIDKKDAYTYLSTCTNAFGESSDFCFFAAERLTAPPRVCYAFFVIFCIFKGVTT